MIHAVLGRATGRVERVIPSGKRGMSGGSPTLLAVSARERIVPLFLLVRMLRVELLNVPSL